MGLSVDSEVGRLRKVIVHRPGLEQRRLTPDNAEDLLFDDVIWVRKAKIEHAAFVQVMKERGVEVFDAEDLLADILEVPEARDWLLDQVLHERQVGQYLAIRGREWADGATPKEIANFLIGGMTKEEIDDGAGLFWSSVGPLDMVLPPLPNFLFQRDPSSWIYGGVTLNPMTKRGPPAGDGDHGGDLPLPSDVQRRRRRQRLVRRGRGGLGPAARSRAATSSRSATAR